MTRSGSIGFWLLAFLACGTPTTIAETPPALPEATAPASAAAPASAFIQALTLAEPSHPLPDGAPAALAYFPASFDRAQAYDLVVFLHGWSGCVNVLMRDAQQPCVEGDDGDDTHEGWNLGERLSAPQRVVLVPQLMFQRRDGSPGRFSDADYARWWLEHALAELHLPSPRSVVLMPHSAGFETALAWAQSGIRIDAIFLMDALYARAPEFFAWAQEGEARVLVSFYTAGSTARQSRRLSRLAEREGLSTRVRQIHTSARHAVVPSVEGPEALREFFEDLHHGSAIVTGD